MCIRDSLNINCGFFLHRRTSGRFTSVASSTRTACPRNSGRTRCGTWSGIFLHFRLCWLCFTCFGLFRELVLCHKPSFRSFFFGVSALVLIFLPVLVGFVIWDGFFVPRVPWVRSFVTVPFLFLVFPMIFSCSYLGPFIFVGFTFSSRLLFCIILLCCLLYTSPSPRDA